MRLVFKQDLQPVLHQTLMEEVQDNLVISNLTVVCRTHLQALILMAVGQALQRVATHTVAYQVRQQALQQQLLGLRLTHLALDR